MSTELAKLNQCTHLSPRGQGCRMLRASDQELCPFHLRQLQIQPPPPTPPDPELFAAEILDSTGNLNTADRVNALLANTVKQFVRGRLDRADALAIGYLAQGLLSTVPGVQKEYQALRAHQAKQAFLKSLNDSKARRGQQLVSKAAKSPAEMQEPEEAQPLESVLQTASETA